MKKMIIVKVCCLLPNLQFLMSSIAEVVVVAGMVW